MTDLCRASLGVLEPAPGTIRLSGQTARYFVESLKWYLSNDRILLTNWKRAGTGGDISFANVPEMAPYFLKAIEQRRRELSRDGGLEPGASRVQPVSVVVIKTTVRGKPFFLHQWDTRSLQFQLIGGRRRGHEVPAETARRELLEEITEQDLVAGRDFQLHPLHDPDSPVEWLGISRTYGALTLYQLSLFRAEFSVDTLKLSDLDRWISLDEMRSGETKAGKRTSSPESVRAADAAIKGGFSGIPSSIDKAQIPGLARYVDVKPGILGVSFDIKRWFGDRS